jgi:hypothetical protein
MYKTTKLLLLCTVLLVITAQSTAQDTVMFNYQGRVKVQGEQFNGNGQFKFAIISPDGSSTLWSNDSSSVDGSEPTTGINIEVTDGVFNILMGSGGQMDAINSTIFQEKAPLKLRTWFSDNVNGFQALQPDHNLLNVNLLTPQTGEGNFTIYVNGQTGDDSNAGLKPNQPKKTIQAAVDIVPARVMANVTIDIADGTYPEEVLLFGINCKPGKALKLQGDVGWTPSAGGAPKVVINGKNGDSRRNVGLQAIQCTGIEITGICFEEVGGTGLLLENGNYAVSNCVSRKNLGGGFAFGNQLRGEAENIVADDNGGDGIVVGTNSRCNLTSPTATRNRYGLFVGDNSACGIRKTGRFSNNRDNGVHCIAFSALACENTYSNGQVQNNGGYGVQVGWNSYLHNGFISKNLFTGNIKGTSNTFNGGQLHY